MTRLALKEHWFLTQQVVIKKPETTPTESFRGDTMSGNHFSQYLMIWRILKFGQVLFLSLQLIHLIVQIKSTCFWGPRPFTENRPQRCFVFDWPGVGVEERGDFLGKWGSRV